MPEFEDLRWLPMKNPQEWINTHFRKPTWPTEAKKHRVYLPAQQLVSKNRRNVTFPATEAGTLLENRLAFTESGAVSRIYFNWRY